MLFASTRAAASSVAKRPIVYNATNHAAAIMENSKGMNVIDRTKRIRKERVALPTRGSAGHVLVQTRRPHQEISQSTSLTGCLHFHQTRLCFFANESAASNTRHIHWSSNLV